MTLLRERISRSPTRIRTGQAIPKVFLGSHMPFAGVKIYTLLTEDDILRGRNMAGAVGWRAPKHREIAEAKAVERELALV